jgi:hypothetical protein
MIARMAEPVSPVERIREGVALVAAEGTARMRFFPNTVAGPSLESRLAEHASASAIAAFTTAKRAVEWWRSVVPASPAGIEYTGIIDFSQERSIYNCGTFSKLFAPGRDFIGEPGAWEAKNHDGIVRDEPFWLLELLKATVEAVDEGTQAIGRTKCRRYSGRADFGLAAAMSKRPMAAPARDAELDLARLDIEAWLDPGGRICRAAFHGVRALTTLDLYEFGQPDPLELPGPAEILPEEP